MNRSLKKIISTREYMKMMLDEIRDYTAKMNKIKQTYYSIQASYHNTFSFISYISSLLIILLAKEITSIFPSTSNP